MYSPNTGDIARQIYECYNSRDFDCALDVISENVEWLDVPRGITNRGKEGVLQFLQGWDRAFPDSKVEIQNLIAGDEWVVVEFVGRGTHTGVLSGPTGAISPTNRRVEQRFCDILQIRGGKVISARSYYDVASLLSQLGIGIERLAA